VLLIAIRLHDGCEKFGDVLETPAFVVPALATHHPNDKDQSLEASGKSKGGATRFAG
jgi:hypothetical protein